MKFRSWKAHQQLYNARPRIQKDGKKKPRQNVSISVDLPRRRYQLLSKARGIVKDINAINFSFVNINCSLGVRYDYVSFDYFNSKQDLDNRDYQMVISIVFQYLMFHWFIHVTLPFFITLDFSGSVNLYLSIRISINDILKWSSILYTIHKFLLHIK